MDVLFFNARNAGDDAGFVYDNPLPLEFNVRVLEYAAEGGCSRAEITARGAISALQMLAQKIGKGVEVRDEKGGVVWRGAAFEVKIADGQTEHAFSMQGMTNSAAIVYYKVNSSNETSGARTMSGWAEDSASVEKYGRIQGLLSGGKLTAEEAAQRIADTLQKMSLPFSGSERREGEAGATLACAGFWHLMSLEFYKDESSRHVYTPQPMYQQWFGEGSGLRKVATRFCLPGDPTITLGGSLSFQQFLVDELTVRVAKWVDMPERLPDASTQADGTPTYRICCEIFSDALAHVADCHRLRETLYTTPANPHQDLPDTSTRVFITRIGGYNSNYGRGGQHNIEPSPKWFAIGDGIRFAFSPDGQSVQYGDLATITNVDKVAVGYYDIARGSNALAQSNRVYISLPGQSLGKAYINAQDIIQTSPSQITFKNFVDANGNPAQVMASSAQALWFVIYRTDPPTGAQGQYLRKGYYILDGSTEMSYTATSKPYLAGSFTMRGASLVYDEPGAVWRHCIPALDNAGGAQIWFKVSGRRQTTDQMIAMAAQSQWVRDCVVEVESGRYTVPYRNGERSIQDEIDALLKLGDAAGNSYVAAFDLWQRLVISVKQDGTMLVDRNGSRITESRPLRVPVAPIICKRDGSLVSPEGKPMPLLPPPMGKFVQYESAMDAPPFYLETAVYIAETGQLDMRSPSKGGALFDAAGVEEGA